MTTAWICPHGYTQYHNGTGCTHYGHGTDSGLGVLQEMWDAWTPVIDRTQHLRPEDFFKLLAEQCGEIDTHLFIGRTDKAVAEVVDIMSIALNWLRNLHADTPEQAVDVIRDRIRSRYVGQTVQITERDFPNGPSVDGFSDPSAA